MSVRPALRRRAVHLVVNAPMANFARVSDAIREAARIATGRSLTPESVREVCSYSWQQIFV